MGKQSAASIRAQRLWSIKVAVGIIAVWCLVFPVVIGVAWNFESMWRLVSFGPHRVNVAFGEVHPYNVEFIPSEETMRVLFGCAAEFLMWLIAFIALTVNRNHKNKTLCYFMISVVIIGFISLPFYILNTELIHGGVPPLYLQREFDGFDLNFYLLKRSTIFWLASAPKLFALGLLVVNLWKLTLPDEPDADVTTSPQKWGLGAILALSVVVAPFAAAALLLTCGLIVSVYDNYYPPRVAKLAEFASAIEAEDARIRREMPQRKAKLAEHSCADGFGLMLELEWRFSSYGPKSATYGRDERILTKSTQGVYDGWKDLCAGYFTDPESWKKAKTWDDLRAIKMTHAQLCADEHIIEYSLNKPPQLNENDRWGSKFRGDEDAQRYARDTVRAWYENAWNEACSKR